MPNHRHYRPTSLVQRWGKVPKRIRKLTMWASVLSVMTGAIVGANRAAPILEPYTPAHRKYVRDIIDVARTEFKNEENGNTYILRDLQIEQAEGKRDAAKEAKAKWGVELTKTTDPITRDLIEKHVNELSSIVDKLDKQIRTLNTMKAIAH